VSWIKMIVRSLILDQPSSEKIFDWCTAVCHVCIRHKYYFHICVLPKYMEETIGIIHFDKDDFDLLAATAIFAFSPDDFKEQHAKRSPDGQIDYDQSCQDAIVNITDKLRRTISSSQRILDAETAFFYRNACNARDVISSQRRAVGWGEERTPTFPTNKLA
jgi:hypothetical protein